MTSHAVNVGDLSRTAMRIREEATFRVDPGSVTYTDIPFASDTLEQAQPYIAQENVNSSRRKQAPVDGGPSTRGAIRADLILGAFDPIFEAVAGGTYVAQAEQTGIEITVAASGNSTTFTRASGDWTSTFSVGDFVIETAALNSANQVVKKVSAVSATVLTLEGGAASAQASVSGCAVTRLKALIDGDTFRSYVIEKDLTQYSNRFLVQRGSIYEGMQLNYGVPGKPQLTFDILGAEQDRTTSEAGDGSPTAAPTNTPPPTSSMQIFEGGQGPGMRCTRATFSAKAGAYPIRHVNQRFPVDFGLGEKAMSGSFEVLVTDTTGWELMDKFHDKTLSSVFWTVKDPEGNHLVIDAPNIRYTAMRAPFLGNGRPSVVQAEWEAEEVTEGANTLLYRVAAYTAP